MKKTLLVIMAAAALFVMSCDDQFVAPPYLPQDGDQNPMLNNQGKVPQNISASHGERRSITVSWDTVPDATLYYVYRANSPLDLFELCAETSSTQFTFNVQPGSTVYYSVSSVMYDGKVSNRSNFTVGTSLAQPVISDITDVSEESASVTWYMENAFDSTYRKDLLYIVYCFNGSTEIAQVLLEAFEISENRTTFTGLIANTRYEYQVEAFLSVNQSASEKSEKFDAATARRFRPGAPEHLTATHGAFADKVELTFVLPDMVDVALGDNMFDPKPLYFAISKRIYSESGHNAYQLVSAYFGVDAKGGQHFEYVPGAYVKWVDNIQDNQRGITYEYLVQSYVDIPARIISSDSSKASTTGWALSRGTVSYGKTAYIPNVFNTEYISAELPINLNFDTKGVIYEFTIVAKVKPIDGDDVPAAEKNDNDPDADFVIRKEHLSYEDVKSYVLKMDLTGKSTAYSPGRGIYSVEIEVNLPDQAVIFTFKAVGSVEISEDTRPIVVENFSVQDGYTNQFVLIWDNHANRQYTIEQSVDGDNWTNIGTVNSDPADEEDEGVTENFKYPVTGQAADISRYFRIRPARFIGEVGREFKSGQPVYAPEAQTLGVPKLSLAEGVSYSTINPVWTEAQKADTYRIKYRYTEDGANAVYKDAALVTTKDIFIDATGNFNFPFKPEGYNDALKAGKEIQVEVEALNKGLQAEVGGAEISTSSVEEVKTKLVGPALLNTSVTKATSSQDISVSWDSVYGAGGYYIFRRQFNLNNNAEEGAEAIVYYLPASTASSINVTGKNLITDASNSRADTTTAVKASASFANSRYTLRDVFLTDNDYYSIAYNNHIQAYKDQQNDIVQGLTYRYYIVPVILRNNVPDPLNAIEFSYNRNGSNKHTNIASYKLRENNADIQYSNAASLEKDGFTIGFGQNVTATKGTYTTEKDSSGYNVSSGIRITWSAPPRLREVTGFTPQYTLYGRTAGTGTWTAILSNVSDTSHAYKPPNTGRDRGRGIAYEYAVGISNAGASGSQPQHSNRFILECAKQLDERGRQKMLGFMLDMIEVEGVSRNELRDSANNFAEEVKWYSGGVSNPYNSDNVIWGIDGYDIFVMNRNISTGWHRIADVTSFPNQLNQNARVSNVQGGSTLTDGLLKVLRDYKHFFKVRSYVKNEDNEKIYCPDPIWAYENRNWWSTNKTPAGHIAASELMQNDYVKWGARQITTDEFIKISTLYMARGLDRANGTAWNTGYFGTRWGSASTTYGGSGRTGASSNFGVTSWDITFENYKDDYWTKAGDCMTFITINGVLWAGTDATNQYPHTYGDKGWINIIGPWDTPGLYSGRIIVGTQGDTDLKWNGNLSGSNIRSRIAVEYPSGTARQNIPYRGEDTPLPFKGQSNNRHEADAWK